MLARILRSYMEILFRVIKWLAINWRFAVLGIAGGVFGYWLARLFAQLPTTERMFSAFGVPMFVFRLIVVIGGI